jgi:hypothetical protein
LAFAGARADILRFTIALLEIEFGFEQWYVALQFLAQHQSGSGIIGITKFSALPVSDLN